MKIGFETPTVPDSGALCVLAYADNALSPSATSVDKATDGAVSAAIASSRFSGKRGSMVEIMSPRGQELSRIIVLGLGKAGDLTPRTLEEAAGGLMARLQCSGETALVVAAEPGEGSTMSGAAFASHLGSGLKLRSYRFDKYRTREPESKKPTLTSVSIHTEDSSEAEALFEQSSAVIGGVFLTRDLVSEPANVLHPESFADEIAKLSVEGLEIEILGETELEKIGMRTLLGVGQGSAKESHVAIMRWNGAPEKSDEPPLALVGKGVTFDTGGISLKPGEGMEEMKWDMGGAGIVTGTMKALAARKAKANVVGIVGLVENMPSSNAQRPGDIVTSLSGQTVEIHNTDAEGRLVLADLLWYCQDRFKPSAMIDLATLTGAMIITLGKVQCAGMFTDDDDLADGLSAAGEATGDRVWRLPLGDEYDRMIDSQVADMKNIGGRPAGSITAAQFLKRFTNKVPWVHLDVAGAVWTAKDGKLFAKGATGYGVRLLDRFIADNHE